MKYYLFILCLVYPFKNLYSQKYKCPLDNGYIMVGYKNNEDQQRYSLFFKVENSIPPIDFTVNTENKTDKVLSICKGKVILVTDEVGGVVAVKDMEHEKIIRYDKIDNIQVKQGDFIDIGQIIGTPKVNEFYPRKRDEYVNEIYFVNISFFVLDTKIRDLIHSPLSVDSIDCRIIVCEKNCQPRIYH